ncbi:MAG TPA: YihY/virulence factor BrkB family protein, partial [Burkholderiales bacterium]|nr:YihY/virulence factor BrkB family protein [Burkholderiales bacterium]
ALQAVLAAARDPASGLVAALVSSVLLLVGATSVFTELKNSLDDLWGIEQPVQSGIMALVRNRILSFGLILVLAFLMLISLIVSAALAVFARYAGDIWSSSAAALVTLSSFISFSVIAALFAVIYKTLPNRVLTWHDVWIGAVVTAALFSLGKYAIGLYLGNSAVASGFGAAGSVIALLLWVYYSAQIFFLGAEFTRQYALRFGSLQHERRRGVRLS